LFEDRESKIEERMLPDQKLVASSQRSATSDQRQATSDTHAVILYDGHCRLCLNCVKIVARLDWLGCFVFRDLHQRDEMADKDSGLDAAKLLDEMHLIFADGRRLSGFYAFRAIARNLPLTWLFWPLLYLPGVDYLGARAYRFIAQHRACINAACKIPAPV